MKTKSILLLLALIILFPGTSGAQPAFVRNRINNAINKKVESDVNAAVDKRIQDSIDANEKRHNTGLFGGKVDIKYNDEYSFTGRIYMQMETYDKKDVMKSDYYTYFNGDTKNAGIEVKAVDPKDGNQALATVFLFDNDNRCFMMLLNNGDSKTGIISTLPSDSALAAQTKTAPTKTAPTKSEKGETQAQPTITKTGNSRTIAGYKCDEYKITEAGKEGYSTVWMTKDVKIKADKKYWGKSGMPTYYNYPGFEGSMMLAMEAFDKDNKPTMKMETKEINEKFSHSIPTVGYTFMKMNFGQAGKK